MVRLNSVYVFFLGVFYASVVFNSFNKITETKEDRTQNREDMTRRRDKDRDKDKDKDRDTNKDRHRDRDRDRDRDGIAKIRGLKTKSAQPCVSLGPIRVCSNPCWIRSDTCPFESGSVYIRIRACWFLRAEPTRLI